MNLYGRAVEFPDSGTWLNVDETLSMEKLKGHVVLLDFWTYCCINCIHVIADLKWLEARFSNKPLVVIGVHSAKFENERQERNIQAAIQRYGIAHPVFVDNEYHLWDRYAIRAWPSFVLIGSDGKILSRTSGEGKRDYLSNEIARALEDGERRGILSREKLEVKPPVPTGGSTLSYPGKISFGNGETLFISDSNNNRILITRLDGKFDATVTDIIGGGSPGMSDGGFEKATFNKPQGIVYSGGHLYIADTENHAIRRASIEERTVTTVSGDGLQGYNWNYSGEASRARLNSPWDLQSDGAYLYIAMAGTHQIWRLDTRSNTIEAFAGNSMENIIDGSLREASFAQPSGLFLNGRRLYVADSEVSAIRFIDLDGGTVHTLAGNGLFSFGHVDGSLSHALFQHPLGIHGEGDFLYVADTYNHAIRRVSPEARRAETLLGTAGGGTCRVDGSECSFLGLFEPNDVKYREGLLYIADTNNHLIRVFDGTKLHDLSIAYV